MWKQVCHIFDHHYFFPQGVEGTIPEDMASLLRASLGL